MVNYHFQIFDSFSIYEGVAVPVITMAKKHACVVVFGDIGRSPRMCNHALSLANEDYNVELVGYNTGSGIPTRVLSHPNIKISSMCPVPAFCYAILHRYLLYAFKVIWQILTLLYVLPWFFGVPDILLLQNPPSIPALPACYFYANYLHRKKTKFIIDWHNYGYTILSMTLGKEHRLVQMSKKIEKTYGPRADANFCVTRAMQKDLSDNWGVQATVLYDKPPEVFKAIELKDKHELLLRLGKDYPIFVVENDGNPRSTAFTEEFAEGRVSERSDRPGLLVSSTSWTEDEDFSILFDALNQYEESCLAQPNKYPHLVCVITGKGPLKLYYADLIADQRWKHVHIVMPWLHADDYPQILACADLGVCLHTSSSGLDLPMKVVDMFGCGLPVAAINFPALPELVRNDENGMVFETSDELALQIKQWFEGYPDKGSKKRTGFSENLKSFQAVRWDQYWRETALSVLEQM